MEKGWAIAMHWMGHSKYTKQEIITTQTIHLLESAVRWNLPGHLLEMASQVSDHLADVPENPKLRFHILLLFTDEERCTCSDYLLKTVLPKKLA